MAKNQISKYVLCSVCSVILNLWFVINLYVGGEWSLSWSRKAAREAESVAAISCSGHGRAYLDGIVVDGKQRPVCECNTCYSGPDCSQLLPDCAANADSGDPLFLEPFWVKNAASSAILVAGWHRMSYIYPDHSYIAQELDSHIRKLHAVVGNAVTVKRFIIFGAGSTQLLNAAIHALSPHNSSSSTKVVATTPFYQVYKTQTDLFRSVDFKFYGDTSLLKNYSGTGTNVVEFVTAPNNPDGKMNKAILGSYAKQIYDHAYYWPHFAPISAPADEDVMLFTISKLTGHAGSRFGWALIKDEAVYERMTNYFSLSTEGVSRDSQLRTLKLMKVILESRGREIFEFGYKTMKSRWEKLSKIVSLSKRFSLQKIPTPQYCSFFQSVRAASPAYAWLRCEMEEDKTCYEVLKAAKIIGREGKIFNAEDRYVRLSLIKRQDDFDQLLQRMNELVSEENENGGAKTMR